MHNPFSINLQSGKFSIAVSLRRKLKENIPLLRVKLLSLGVSFGFQQVNNPLLEFSLNNDFTIFH